MLFDILAFHVCLAFLKRYSLRIAEYYDQRNTITDVYDVSSLTTAFYFGCFVHRNNNKVPDHNLFIKDVPGYGQMGLVETHCKRVLRVCVASSAIPA